MPKHRGGKSSGGKRRRASSKRRRSRSGGQIPIKVLEHRLARLGQIVARRTGIRATGVSLTR